MARKDLVICFVITLLFTLLICPVFNAPFAVGDDHRIIAMNHPEKMEPAYVNALFGNSPDLLGSIKNDAQIGRFRPLGWTFTKIQCVLFGGNFTAWRIANVFVLLLSLLVFSAVSRKLNIGTAATWTMLFVYAFGRNNETWRTLIPPAQNIGELFLLSGFLFWLKYRGENKNICKTFSLLFFLCAAMVKESFIFCIPFVWLADFLFFSKEKKLFVKDYFQLAAVFLIPFAGLVSILFFSKTIYSYPYPDSSIEILGYNAWQFFYSSAFLIAPLLMFFMRSHVITRRNLVKLLLITLSWLIIQLILLKGIKMDDQHHYLVPGLLLVLLLSAFAIHFIQFRSKKIQRGVIGIYILFGMWQAKNTFVNAGFYAAQVQSFYNVVNEMKASPSSKIYYAGIRSYPGDWLMGTSAILRNEGFKGSLIFYSGADKTELWEKKFLASRPPLQFPSVDFNTFNPGEGGWLINVECVNQLIDGGTYTMGFSGCGVKLPPIIESGQFEKRPILQSASYYDVRLLDFKNGIIQKKYIEYEVIPIKWKRRN